MGLPDRNNPQVGDRFTNSHGVAWEVRGIDGADVWVRNPANGARSVTKLHYVAAWTPVPPPTPGPDEVWAVIEGNTPLSWWYGRAPVTRHPVVRYVKADPQ